LLVGRVFEGVRDLGGFAEGADAAAVPGADEDCGDGGEEDVAGDMLVEELRGGMRIEVGVVESCEDVPIVAVDFDDSHCCFSV
jgi:hypothetical protein